MKKLLPILLLSTLFATACKKHDCEVRNAACKDVPPTNEMCAAAFSRWFYDAQTAQCQLVNYSGCSQKGFATQPECEKCVKGTK